MGNLRMSLIWLVVLVAFGAAAYLRLAPSDPAHWHQAAAFHDIAPKQGKRFYIWRQGVEAAGAEKLATLNRIIAQTPRTSLLAGSLETRQLTYITRSKVMGFPDYTTLGIYQARDGQRYLEIYGRSRFGRSDLGVNADRIKRWLRQAQI
ncbi:MAG: hypothetical protein ACJAVM_003453 [Sulfitobacter sp.]|jgi:uncharacterized protein (DUF1499 family)